MRNMNIDQQQQPLQNQSRVCTERDAERAVELLRRLRQQANYNNFHNNNVVEQLDLLEQVLDSDLFKSVCQIYDQIYDSANMNGSSELKASATSKATVAVFTSSIAHTHPRTIELPKIGEGLGFNVMSYEDSPVFISQIIPGGVADKHGGLRKGDQIVSVNGIEIGQANHTYAVELLKDAKNTVVLVVKYMPGLLNEIESSYQLKQHQHEHN